MSWFPFRSGQSWRGPDGEDNMTEADWQQRGLDQAMAMREGGNAFDSSPDQGGDSTGGYYNGDYSDAVHAAFNRRLDTDEYYEAEVDQDLRALLSADTERRADPDSD